MYDEITIQDIPHCAACGRAIGATEDWHTLNDHTDVCTDCHADMEAELSDALAEEEEEELDDLDRHMIELAEQRAAYADIVGGRGVWR